MLNSSSRSADAGDVAMDRWLADRYAGVKSREVVPTQKSAPPVETRTARRRADELLAELGRDVRRRRIRRGMWCLAGLTCAVVGVAVLLRVLGVV